MLTEILSSDKIKLQGSDRPIKSTGEMSQESDQFAKILSSIDKGVSSNSKSDIFKSLESMFEDDKDFLKESFSFLKGREVEPKLVESNENSSLESFGSTGIIESTEKNSPLLGMNFGNYKAVSDEKTEDANFKIIINTAKDFLKGELIKKSVPSTDMPNTLRGLTKLAESKGISLKDVKFSLEESADTIPEKQADGKMIINQHSTEALFRNKSQNIILRAGKTDRTPENLTKNIQENSSKVINETKKFDLASILSGETPIVEKKPVSTLNLSLSTEPKSLGDILKSKDSIQLIDKNRDNQKSIPKNLGMADKIGKTLNMSPEFVSSLFSEEDMADLGIDQKTVTKTEEKEIFAEETLLRETDKLKSGLELKIGEAKTMSKHLASNLQEQIDNYRNPFQKLTLTLNPQNLGEVEVDIMKRGNSVKISLSGSTQTIAILSANSLELRNQLVEVGLENPSFKFNEDGRNDSQQQEEQRHKDEREKANKTLAEDEQIDTFEIESILKTA